MSTFTFEINGLLNLRQAKQRLGVTRQTIYAMIKRGDLETIGIGSRRYFFSQQVEALATKRGMPDAANTHD